MVSSNGSNGNRNNGYHTCAGGKRHRQDLFLAGIAVHGKIQKAADDTPMARTAHYEWMKDPEYRERFTEAMERYKEGLEQEAHRRAVEGVEEPVYQGGALVGTKKRYSDRLLIKLLEAKIPEQYREHKAPPPPASRDHILETREMRIKRLWEEYEKLRGIQSSQSSENVND